MKRKIITTLAIVALVFTLLPSTVFAAPTHSWEPVVFGGTPVSGVERGEPGYFEFYMKYKCTCNNPGSYEVYDDAHWTAQKTTKELEIEEYGDSTCSKQGAVIYYYEGQYLGTGEHYRKGLVCKLPLLPHDYDVMYSNVWESNPKAQPGDEDYYLTKDVKRLHKCVACGHQEYFSAKEVLLQKEPDATCFNDGTAYYSAFWNITPNYFMQTKKVVIPAGHKWSAWKVSKKATALNSGKEYRTCLRDASHKETKVIPALGIKGTQLAKMTARGNTSLSIAWSKITNAEGYDIFFTNCGKTTTFQKVKTITGNETFSWVKTGLKKNACYKAYVRAWAKKDGKKQYVTKSPAVHTYTANGTKNYTVTKSVDVNKTSVTLAKGKTFAIKASVVKLDKAKKLMPADHAPALRYKSSDSNIATVSSTGKITAKAKGTCKVYAYSHNGVTKTVGVSVK